jgi:hypothetical protein
MIAAQLLSVAFASALVVLDLGIPTGAAHAAKPVDGAFAILVDCAAGQSINDALAKLPSGKRAVLTIRGTCVENVVVNRDDVTLRAEAPGAGVSGPAAEANRSAIVVEASRVMLDGLTVTGPWNGIVGVGAARLTIQNCTVSGVGRTGIVFFHNSNGLVEGCSVTGSARDGVAIEAASAAITNSTISGNGRSGVLVTNAASARIGLRVSGEAGGNQIVNNAGTGIHVSIGAGAFIYGNTVSGNGANPATAGGLCCYGIAVNGANADLPGDNMVVNNTGSGLFLRAGNVVVGDTTFGIGTTVNTFSGNGFGSSDKSGIFVFQGSLLRLSDAVVTGNDFAGVQLFLGGIADILSSTISGNPRGIQAFLRSTVRLRTGTAVTGNAGNGVEIGRGSTLEMRAAAPAPTVSGNGAQGLDCFDGESSYFDPGGTITDPISASCSGF